MLAGLLYVGAGVGLARVPMVRAAFGLSAARTAPAARHSMARRRHRVRRHPRSVADDVRPQQDFGRLGIAAAHRRCCDHGISWRSSMRMSTGAWCSARFSIVLGALCCRGGPAYRRYRSGLHRRRVPLLRHRRQADAQAASATRLCIATIRACCRGSNIGIAFWRGSAVPTIGTAAWRRCWGFRDGVSLVLFMLALRHLARLAPAPISRWRLSLETDRSRRWASR